MCNKNDKNKLASQKSTKRNTNSKRSKRERLVRMPGRTRRVFLVTIGHAMIEKMSLKKTRNVDNLVCLI